jgi:FK506-binding nuclear protein
MDTEALSGSAQKKLNKKLKAEGGRAVATGSGDEEKKSKKDKKKEKQKEKKEEKEKPKTDAEGGQKEKKGGAARILEGGIKVVEGTPGTGVQAKKGNTVSMRYIGKLTSGKTFDQNTKGKPVRSVLRLFIATTDLLFGSILSSSRSA